MMIIAITLGENTIFWPWCEIISNYFTKIGCKTILFKTDTLDEIPDCHICFVLLPHRYPRFVNQPKVFYICWQTEQMPLHCDENDFKHSQLRFGQMNKYYDNYDLHLTVGQDRARYLQDAGYDFLPLDFGFSPTLQFERIDAIPKYDVIFYGSMSPRRETIINQLKRNDISVHPYHRFTSYEEQIIAWAESKIVLNLHFSEQQLFEAQRIIVCLTNGLFVISESACEKHIFTQGEHLIFSDDLPQTIKHFLKDEEARKKIAKKGQHYVCEKTSMTKNLEALANRLRKKRIPYL